MKSELKFKTVFGLITIIAGLATGLWLLQSQIRSVSKASVDTIPANITVSNVSDTSFSVSWTTPQSTSGYVVYGESVSDMNNSVSDDRDQEQGTPSPYMAHIVTIQGLKPETVYRFRVGSDKHTFDLNGSPYQVTTGPSLGNKPAADVAYGQIVTLSGEPAEGVLVYLEIAGGVKQAALTKLNGSWAIPLSTIRAANLSEYLTYDKKLSKINIQVDGGAIGSSVGQTTTDQDNPVKEIVLGQNFDLIQATSEDVEVKAEKESKMGVINKKELILLSPSAEEKVNSGKPEIIGTAPKGAEIQIIINSKSQIIGTVIAADDGSFSFSVPTNLEPGEHTVTISTVIDGVIKQITRSFTVYAVGESFEPAYSATPSASPVPTVTPTTIPSITSRPSPTITIKPTAIQSPTPTKTPVPTVTIKPTTLTPTAVPTPTTTIKPSPTPPIKLEDSGSVEQTIQILLFGSLLTIAGLVWYKKAW